MSWFTDWRASKDLSESKVSEYNQELLKTLEELVEIYKWQKGASAKDDLAVIRAEELIKKTKGEV